MGPSLGDIIGEREGQQSTERSGFLLCSAEELLHRLGTCAGPLTSGREVRALSIFSSEMHRCTEGGSSFSASQK